MPFFGKSHDQSIRRAQYAGSWYESDAKQLRAQLEKYLAGAAADSATKSDIAIDHPLLAIISPHAGYLYSGATAAFSYASAKPRQIKRVFLLGPSHHAALHGVALSDATSFETPLGTLKVDLDIIQELQTYPLFSVQPGIHQIEHSLELQLPFVRATFGDVPIVPIVVGQLDDEQEVRLIAEVLKGFVSQNDLVIVSSDFTHYGPRFDYLPFGTDFTRSVHQLDEQAFSYIASLNPQKFLEFQEQTHATICGFYPIAVLMAMLPAGTQASLLKYATSQDVATDDTENSVSYLAIAFHGKAWPMDASTRIAANEMIGLSDTDKQTLIEIARRAVRLYVEKHESFDPEREGLSIGDTLREPRGTFVSIYKTAAADSTERRTLHPNKELRGCVGSIWPVRPLFQAVAENAIASASRDYRFDPIGPTELKDLAFEISVLTLPRRVASYRDIVIGTDGIILSKHSRQSVFLPFVPTEFGWDLNETLTQLSIKAGLKADDWKEGAKFDLFQSVSIESH